MSNIFIVWHVDVPPAVNANRYTMSYHGQIIAIRVVFIKKLFTASCLPVHIIRAKFRKLRIKNFLVELLYID